MQREDVERLATELDRQDEYAPLGHVGWEAAATLRALLAERDALQGQLNDLRNGWANSVKAHAALLAERDAAYRAGYRDGFSVTGEGGNQEYPWDQFGRDPEQDEDWLAHRESLLSKYKSRP